MDTAIRIARAYEEMRYDAISIGPRDLSAGAVFFESIGISNLPWVSMNVYSPDKTLLRSPYLKITRNGTRFAILGLTDYSAPHPDFIITDGLKEMAEILSELRDSFDIIILLTTLPHEKTVLLAQEYPELDIIIGGDVKKGNIKGFLRDNTLITQTAGQGRYLGNARITWRGRPWGREFENILDGLKASLQNVNRQIAGLRFQRNTRVNIDDMKQQLIDRRKDILDQIRKEESRIKSSTPVNASTFSTVIFPLNSSVPEDPDIKQISEQPVDIIKAEEKL